MFYLLRTKKTPSIHGICCIFDRKGKVWPDQVGMNWLISNKSNSLLLWRKTFFENRSQLQHIVFSSYQPNHPLLKVRAKTCLLWELSAQFLSKLNKITNFCLKRCTTTLKPKTFLDILPSSYFSLCFAPWKWSYIKLWSYFQENWFVLMILCPLLMSRTSRLMFILNVILLSTLKIPQKWTDQTRTEKQLQILWKTQLLHK